MVGIKTLASSSKGNCYIVSDGQNKLIIECGISIKKIKKGLDFNLSSVDGLLLSHSHGDHSKAIKDVIRCGIDVYTSQGTLDKLNIKSHRTKVVKSLNKFRINNWVILPFETKHDDPEPLGFLIVSKSGKKILFATDTYYLKYKFKNLNFMMLECNYALDILNENIRTGRVPAVQKKRLLKSHFSLENVKSFLKANDLAQVQVIHLLHLSERNSDADRFKREIQELTGKMVLVADQ
ncbi:Phosphoribosyl 1,2-cyclic phosphodiesterase [Orenia metallireducens]|uniref:Phosphoribosyl 1,2-cyclic phosphodiesterase n=1 Tax=Orenia metallireducens TaxID=1413210 RepID=A0A285G7E7_9FIRM|nr:MBL fold metallo-hydrolase [Orenia metallireducens]SNY19283.1 Phosphoribosyl 1,2-cyclic phosphodiesterase [Orenia metallireducens]